MANESLNLDLLIRVIDEGAKKKIDGVQHSINRLGQVSSGADRGVRRIGNTLNSPAYVAAPKNLDKITKSIKASEVAAGLGAAGMGKYGTILTGIVTPAGAATVAIAALGLGVAKLVKAAVDFKSKELDEHLRRVANQAEAASSGWDAYLSAISVGSARVDAEQSKILAEAQTRFDQERQAANERIKIIEKEVQQRVKALERIKRGEFEAALLVAKEIDDITDMDAVRAHLSKTIEENTQKIEAERLALVPHAKALGDLNKRLKDRKELAGDAMTADEIQAARAKALARAHELAAAAATNRALAEQKLIEQSLQGEGFEVNLGMDPDEAERLEAMMQRQIDLSFQWAAARRQVIGTMKDEAESVFIMSAVDAYNAYADALDRTVSLNAIFAGGFDRAMRNVAASAVRSLGQRAAFEAAFELAAGFRDLATPGMQGAALIHFKSAGMFAAIAAAAGIGGGLLSVQGPGAPGAGGPVGGGRSDSSGSGRTVNLSVVTIGVLDSEARKEIARQLQQEILEGG